MRAYTFLDRGPLAKSYALKFLSVAFLGIHVPLFGLVAYAVINSMEHAGIILGLTLVLTLISTALTLYALNALLAPVRLLKKAMEHFHHNGEAVTLPCHHKDELGHLMSATQQTICDRKAIELERQRMVQRLRVRNQNLREQLVVTRNLESFEHLASHDLQEPIRALSIELQYLKRLSGERMTEEQLVIWDRLFASCDKLKKSIHGLVELVGLKQHPQPQQVDLSTLWKAAWEERAMHNPAPELPKLQAVEGSPTLLKRLFSELIDNANKFRSPDRPLNMAVHGRCDERHLYLWIADNGRGFDAEHKNRIFAMFEKLDGANTPGIGLGLTMCREIAALHHGSLTADSEEDKGTTFLLQLPLKQQQNSEPAIQIREHSPFDKPQYGIPA